MSRLLSSFLVFLSLSYVASADFVVTVGNSVSSNRAQPVSVVAGDTVTLGIYLHSNLTTNSLQFTSVGMAFDIAAPGAINFYDGNSPAFRTLFTNFAVSIPAPLTGTADITPPTFVDSSSTTANGYDVLVDITPSLQSLPVNGTQSTAQHFANVSFTVGASTTPGLYGFKFNPLASFSDGAPANSSGPIGLTFEAGADGAAFNRFTVTAIPEPSSLLLGGLALGWIGWRNRRKHLCGKKDRVMAM